jgi:outer membrane protein OmpA-like peptidoglycan-associated protein
MRTFLAGILCFSLTYSIVSAQGDTEKLPPGINTPEYDETSPVLSSNGERLFFTRTADPDFEPTLTDQFDHSLVTAKDENYKQRLAAIFSQIAGQEISDPYASIYNQDIWYASLKDGTMGEAIHPGYPLNNALPNSLVSIGMEKEEYVIINQFYEDGSMFAGFSRVHIGEDGKYVFPKPMYIFEFYLTNADVNLTMTPDGHVLVISMKRSDGLGFNDLYVSFYIRENLWSAPKHMGTILNTPFQETSPHISPDKRYLYFASNRPGSAGGNDLYVSERLNYSWASWSEPVRVKGDVNSPFDESQPYFDPKAEYLYFTSKRDGSSDIFRQRQTPKLTLKKPLFVRGKIIDAFTGQPVHSELLWGQQSSSQYLEYFNTYTGEFEVTLTEYETYKFQARKPNHKTQQILVDPRELEAQGIDTLDLVLYLEPKEIWDMTMPMVKKNMRKNSPALKSPVANESITFYNINFIKGKAIILARSRSALTYIYDLMIEHPSMEILIEGHTDNVGDELALENLSLQRAEAIRDYLVYEGIDVNRMQVIGKGATEPISTNRLEIGRQKNRRVEITMLKKQE